MPAYEAAEGPKALKRPGFGAEPRSKKKVNIPNAYFNKRMPIFVSECLFFKRMPISLEANLRPLRGRRPRCGRSPGFGGEAPEKERNKTAYAYHFDPRARFKDLRCIFC